MVDDAEYTDIPSDLWGLGDCHSQPPFVDSIEFRVGLGTDKPYLVRSAHSPHRRVEHRTPVDVVQRTTLGSREPCSIAAGPGRSSQGGDQWDNALSCEWAWR